MQYLNPNTKLKKEKQLKTTTLITFSIGYHSLNVLIICDSKLNIISVDASYPGATHNSVVWANHPLRAYIERLHTTSGEDLYLLGDSGYPLRTTMMVPLSNPQPNSPEEHYQKLHLSARNTVERCIGVLKARFRCLLVDRKLHYSPGVAARIANACCVLHNIAHGENISFSPLTAEEATRECRLTQHASVRDSHIRHAYSVTDLELGRARREAPINRL
ncbi:hypothetical protein evm_015060 [Chilo suppressalis]|nr:hypothetical protein evm_015060 [Chilo suppressalis]